MFAYGAARRSRRWEIGYAAHREKLETALKHPSDAMTQGGMQPVDLEDEELKALIATSRA